MLIVAILTKLHPPDPHATSISSYGIASIVMIYLEAASYNMSWGPVPWLYMSEIFPTRIREMGIAVGTATQWLFNFVFSQITPHAVKNLGWRTFLMFCIFNWALVVYAWIFIKETTGKSLEEMEHGKYPHKCFPFVAIARWTADVVCTQYSIQRRQLHTWMPSSQRRVRWERPSMSRWQSEEQYL